MIGTGSLQPVQWEGSLSYIKEAGREAGRQGGREGSQLTEWR